MTTRKNGPKTARGPDGKFGLGNPGRPKGARHKSTLAIEALLEGEAEGLTRKAVELALHGDTTALRLCMDRIAPPKKDTPVRFSMNKVDCAQDAAEAAQSVLHAVADGDLTPTEARRVMALVEGYRKTLETAELEKRLTELEARL